MSDARFVHGGLMRHIVVMSSTSAIGLMALFLVDLLDMYFISLLGHAELAAAVGFAGSLVFFNTSVSIGASIAMGALVSRSLGAKDMAGARRFGASAMLFSLIIGSLISMLMVSNVESLLALIGAKGLVADKAADYLCILMPSAPILAMAMAASAALRATGDAKRAMLATLAGGIVNAILDPLFIFGLNMGIEGRSGRLSGGAYQHFCDCGLWHDLPPRFDGTTALAGFSVQSETYRRHCPARDSCEYRHAVRQCLCHPVYRQLWD